MRIASLIPSFSYGPLTPEEIAALQEAAMQPTDQLIAVAALCDACVVSRDEARVMLGLAAR